VRTKDPARRCEIAGRFADRSQLVFVDAFRIIEQSSDHRGLAIVHAPAVLNARVGFGSRGSHCWASGVACT